MQNYGRAASPLVDAVMDTTLSDAAGNIVKNNANAASEIHKAAQACQAELQKLQR
jgi:hypothetical protein